MRTLRQEQPFKPNNTQSHDEIYMYIHYTILHTHTHTHTHTETCIVIVNAMYVQCTGIE